MTTCDETAGVTFYFPYTGLEIRPLSVDYRQSIGKLDIAQTKFSEEVGDYIKPYLESNTDFRKPQPVILDGISGPIQRLYFRPDFARISNTETHIEFRDPLHFLESGVIDLKVDGLTLKEAYRRVFNRRSDTPASIFEGIKFDIPSEIPHEIIGPGTLVEDGITGRRRALKKETEGNAIILNSNENIDFNQITPAKAFAKLNDLFSLQTWVDQDGYLRVGRHETVQMYHVAAEDDDRVWKLIEPQITQPREPIKKVTVKGAMMDYNTEQTGDNKPNHVSAFVDSQPEIEDYRALGIAEREDLGWGVTKTFDGEDVQRESLPYVALKKYFDIRRDQEQGSLKINPKKSGDVVSSVEELRLGDLVKAISPGDCNSSFERGTYRVNGINHSIDGMDWQLRLDVEVFIDEKVNSKLRFLNPRSHEIVSEEDIFE